MLAEIIKNGVKLETIGGSYAVSKYTNSRRKLLYRPLGGVLVLRLIKPIIRYLKELVRTLILLVVAANYL
jgi:hypothetical protein